MTYHSEQVIVYLSVRDEAPLSRSEIVGRARDVVSKAISDWYKSDAEARETLAYDPDVDGSVVDA